MQIRGDSSPDILRRDQNRSIVSRSNKRRRLDGDFELGQNVFVDREGFDRLLAIGFHGDLPIAQRRFFGKLQR